MEFLLLLLLPLLGSVLGDSATAEDDDPPPDEASAKQAAAHDRDEHDAEDDRDTADETEDQPSLPGGDAEDAAPVAEVATVPDFDGSTETLTLQVDKDLLGHATRADLTAETDRESGNITLALAGQNIAVLTDPRGFDLANISLEAA